MGRFKHYGYVNDAPAIAKHLELARFEEKLRFRKGAHKLFFGTPLESETVRCKHRMTIKDLKYFFMDRSNILHKISAKERQYLATLYGNDFERLFSKKNAARVSHND